MVNIETQAPGDAGRHITVYWMPGCSSCLRLKEFVEKTGKPFEAVNVDEHPERASHLRDRNIHIPALCVDDECVNGVHLATVAGLLGVPYDPPKVLEPRVLRDRYHTVVDVLCQNVTQISAAVADFKLPGRNRSLIETAGHAACVMRYFLGKYDDADYDLFFDDLEPDARIAEAVTAFARQTETMFEQWWTRDGVDDPLEEVVTLYWGPRTLHEALEREVWHTAQHTRQVIFMLEQAGITPTRPFTVEDLAGLPLPERIYD